MNASSSFWLITLSSTISTLIGGTVPSIKPPKAPPLGEVTFLTLRFGRGDAVLAVGLRVLCVGDSEGAAGAGGVGSDGCDGVVPCPFTAKAGSGSKYRLENGGEKVYQMSKSHVPFAAGAGTEVGEAVVCLANGGLRGCRLGRLPGDGRGGTLPVLRTDMAGV